MSATENPNWSVVAICLALLGLVLAYLFLRAIGRIVRQVVEDHAIEAAEQERERAEALYALHRDQSLNDQGRETIEEIRLLVSDFREVLDVIGLMQPEDWAARRVPLDRRLDSLDDRLASKQAAMELAGA